MLYTQVLVRVGLGRRTSDAAEAAEAAAPAAPHPAPGAGGLLLLNVKGGAAAKTPVAFGAQALPRLLPC